MQPDPIRNKQRPIVDVILDDRRVTGFLKAEFQARKDLGESRYGVALQAFNGRDALRDAFDEALDLCIYLMQVVKEAEENSMERLNMGHQYNCALSIAEALSFAVQGRKQS